MGSLSALDCFYSKETDLKSVQCCSSSLYSYFSISDDCFIVKLPKKNDITELNSNIRAKAIHSLLRIKLKIYGDFRALYNFMNHYEQASHMSTVLLYVSPHCFEIG